MRQWMGMIALFVLALPVQAEEPFADVIGNGLQRPRPYKMTGPVEIPYITWGGDVVSFYANGGLNTTPESIYGKMGLKIRLVPGDDFIGQVRNLLSAKSPFLRAELRMLALASEVVNKDPATRQDVIMQLTWSAGDHMVGRPSVRKANDLKGKKVVLQKYGPHVGMLDDILRSAKLTWDDVTVVWAKDLTASDNSPAAIFRKDPSVDAAFVITPDMIGLTGGADQEGSGAEGTVKGSKVAVSTAQMSRSLADVYSTSDEFKKQYPDFVRKFVAGYMKATVEVAALRAAFHKDPKSNEGKQYVQRVLKLAQDIYGKTVLPTLEVDAAGLMDDATLVGLEGNAAFFEQEGNLAGYSEKLKGALELAKGQGYTSIKSGFAGPGFTFESIASLAGLKYTAPSRNRQRINPEAISIGANDTLDDKTLVAFSIAFEPNESKFDPSVYASDFQQVVQNLTLYGNAVLVVRGHSDPSQTLRELVLAGKSKGLIKEQRVGNKRTYYFNGKVLDLTNTREMIKAIESGEFSGVHDHDPEQVMQAALNLSKVRTEAVKAALVQFAKDNNLSLDVSQIQGQGVGIAEPLVAKPSNMDEVRQNMRVEFRMIKVSGESIKQSDLDF